MTVQFFPAVELADEHGLLAVGGDLDVESLVLAYKSGIFPWPVDEGLPITWFAPPKRALLFLDDLHISKSLRRELRRNTYTFTFDANFASVIYACAELKNRGEQRGTWITRAMVEAYIKLHKAGYAHSIECYEGANLIAGIYGVGIGTMFAGESMFYRKPNASKLCLCLLAEHLREGGAKWIDCQVMTPLLKNFGAKEIPRKEFMELLLEALDADGSGLFRITKD